VLGVLVLAAPQETIRQQEWKIERLTKDNRGLEASNCELRAQLEALKEENLQVRICVCTCMRVLGGSSADSSQRAWLAPAGH
jgi:hypothetical protein